MTCSKTVPYKQFDNNSCDYIKFKTFHLIIIAWAIGMVVIVSLAVSLMILRASSSASEAPNRNKTRRMFDNYMEDTQIHSIHHRSPLAPQLLKPLDQNFNAMEDDAIHLMQRLEIQSNHKPENSINSSPPMGWVPSNPSLPTALPLNQVPLYNNQIPRPPRLVRSQSENHHRQFMGPTYDTPRPFNFPLIGPTPSEFRKPMENNREGIPAKSGRINNIQDILRQEQVVNLNPYPPMPIGVHISGSFKNLKKSGLSNFFRKFVPVQLQMSPSQIRYQHIPFDPFYTFKPKSLNEINALAIKQFNLHRSKKNKKNRLPMIPGLVFQPNAYRPVPTDYLVDATRINNTYQGFTGYHNPNSDPFSMQLEVYPIRAGKKVNLLPVLAEPHLVTTVRPNIYNLEPLHAYPAVPYGIPVHPGVQYLNYAPKYKTNAPPSPSLYSGSNIRPVSTKSNQQKPKETPSPPLMVHFNVFPNKNDNPAPQTQHVYDVISAEVHERKSTPPINAKEEKATFIDCETGEQFSEDELDPSEYEKQQSFTNNGIPQVGHLVPSVEQVYQHTLLDVNGPSNFQQNLSTFRLPVENMVQFHANDAVI